MMRLFTALYLVLMGLPLHAQNITELDRYLQAVVKEGFGSEIAQTQHAQAESDFKVFRSSMRPQLRLNANLPTYSRTSTSVVQPNGSIAFQPLNQNLASVTVSATQPILLTGGTLFVEAGLDRFDDFGRRFTQYNGVPVRIGYTQSLVGFNALKWDRRMATRQRGWAAQQHDVAINAVQREAANRYFNVLIARMNQRLAQSNREINAKLLRLAEERLALGKISLEEKLQMESELKWAQLLAAQAAKEVEQTTLAMGELLKGKLTVDSTLRTPSVLGFDLPPLDVLVQLAVQNAPEVQSSELELAIRERDAAERRAQSGVNVQVYAATGLVQSGNQVSDIYQAPFNEQQIQAGVSIPLIDWGTRSGVKSSTQARVQQARLTLDQQRKAAEIAVKRAYLDIREIGARMALHEELLALAEERANISTERYTSGKLALTEWVLTQRNRDQMQRDYLISLRDLYLAYFELRLLTGYDIRAQRNQHPNHNNR
ncbi:MAG: TolC family protein [Flavobacteriales bacterium]